MKNYLLFVFVLIASLIFAQTNPIPDANFENYLETHNATGTVVAIGDPTSMGDGIAHNGLVLMSRINSVLALNISNLSISDVTGLEGFSSLTNLNCAYNDIVTMDIAPVSTLENLRCNNNKLTALDLSQNLQLLRLDCNSNELVVLNVSLNLQLNWLNCSNNFLEVLNVKNANNTNFLIFNATSNIDLTCITVDNPIYSTTNWTNIDAQTSFNHNCASPETYVPDNNFETYLETHDATGAVVAIGAATSMGNGIANDDYVTTANINTITNLDVSNQNIADLTGIEDFVALTHLDCYTNQINNLDVSNNINLIDLWCGYNNLTIIDTSNLNLLEDFRSNNNSITSFDTSNNSNLIRLITTNNPINTLNISQNINLVHLDSQNNLLNTLDVSQNNLLEVISCGNNNLTSLNVSNNSQLTYIECRNNNLTNINLNNNLVLERLLTWSNNITNLDVHLNTNLYQLYIENNNLNSLNFKNGNNINITDYYFRATGNPNLTCIEVDSPIYSTTNWTDIDPQTSFSNDCPNLCSYPSNLTATNFIPAGATLDWQENGTATTWDIEIGLQGFTPTGTVTNDDVTNPFVWVGGTPNTNYDYYVHADCGGNNIDTSAWVGPFSFNTINATVCESNFELVNGTPFYHAWYSSMAFADIDNDGDQDVLITGRESNTTTPKGKLYKNDGLGNFSLVTSTLFIGNQMGDLAFADVDSDGDQDVLITGINGTQLYTNGGLGNFTLITGTPFDNAYYSSIAFADIDNDGDQDVLITGLNFSGQAISKLYTNDGLGVFTLDANTPFDGVYSGSIAFADIDNDNDQDILITGYILSTSQFSSKLYTNDGSGNFTLVTGTPFDNVNNSSIAFSDIDNDGDQDVLITGQSYSGNISKLYINDGFGVFTLDLSTPFDGIYSGSMAFADIDNDGDQDVLITGKNSSGHRISKLYANDGLGNFYLVVGTLLESVFHSSIAFADVDNDGDQDVIITGETTSSFTGHLGISKLYKNNLIYDTKYTSTGWTNGTPTLNKCAVIDQDYTTTSLSSYKTTVNATKTLTVAANTYMQVQKNIVNNGTITIEPTGSIVQMKDTATVTGTGIFNTKIATTPLQDTTRYTYFSSPSATETLNIFATWADLNYLWEFNETTQGWDYITNTATPMQAGNGYIVRGNASNAYPNYVGLTSFQNAYNNGVVTQNLHFKGDGSATANLDNDNNLVGNPYPSAISGIKLLNGTLNPTAGTLYFWTHNSAMVAGDFSTDDYAMWNLSGGTVAISGGVVPTGYIASGQGFFIEAEGDETLPLGQEVISTLTFNNEMRETGNNTDFRRPENPEYDKIWLNLTNTDGVFNQLLVSFFPNTTTAYEHTYDGKRSPNGVATFYSMGLNNEHFGIQALPLLQDETLVPLGYQIENEDISNLQISIDHVENLEDITIYLKDNLLGAIHDLSQNAYSFSVTDTGIFDTRFELLFRNSALSDEDIVFSESLIVSNVNEDQILVKTAHGSIINKIEVFDSLGRLIINSRHQDAVVNLQVSNINQGTVLFIKVTLENGAIMHKKIIKL